MTISFSRLAAVAVTALIALPIAWSAAVAQTAERARQSTADTSWTGPSLAESASTLPGGQVLGELYFYDVSTVGAVGTSGDHHSTPHAHGYGSLASIIVGVTDRLAAGFVPTIGYNAIENSPSSSRLQ